MRLNNQMVVLMSDLGNIIIDSIDNDVINMLREQGHYELFMSQVERVKDIPNIVVRMNFDYDEMTVMYAYYYNQSDGDNGFLMVVLPPMVAEDSEILKDISEVFETNETGPARVLWVDDPERRN